MCAYLGMLSKTAIPVYLTMAGGLLALLASDDPSRRAVLPVSVDLVGMQVDVCLSLHQPPDATENPVEVSTRGSSKIFFEVGTSMITMRVEVAVSPVLAVAT